MAVIENRVTEIGDVILISTDVPVIGLIALNSFVDTTVGETGTRLFFKEFKFSLDGINFSDWIELTDPNLQLIQIESADTFRAEYRYTRVGVDPSGELEFVDVDLDADVVAVDCGDIYNNSIFSEYFSCTDPGVLNWAINVLEKLYLKGLVPNYITRGQIATEDRDYLDFFHGITTFYSYLVNYARVFENFHTNTALLSEYLTQRGLFLCGTEDLGELLFLMRNFNSEISHRGTINIVKKKGEDGKQVDGELLRAICFDVTCDEFIFNLLREENYGWNVGNSSPLYTSVSEQVNKSYEDTEDFIDINKYPLINNGFVSIVTDVDKEVLQIDAVTAGLISGIGLLSPDPIAGFGINVDPGIDYEVVFQVRQVNLEQTFTFGCIAYNAADQVISLNSIIDGLVKNFFFEEIQLNKNDIYYVARGFLYNKDEPNIAVPDGVPEIGFGQHLRMNSNVCKIIPYIVVDNTSGGGASGALNIFDLKIRPLKADYSRSYIQAVNLVEMFLKNRNDAMTAQQFEEILRRYLLPYNSSFLVNYL